ncbi:hypothetical protein H0H87_008414 [Tephrocybe sp. NHM501043]|nr:hypothetical protein H0H87_008414 [Tephrocybe sp. NHM501043]
MNFTPRTPMSLILGSNYAAPARTQSTPTIHGAHKRSTSTSSTTSISSTLSTTSTTSQNNVSSLRERRGVTFQLTLDGRLPETITPKAQLEPFDNIPRRTRALPTPATNFNYEAAMGKMGTKSARLRDFGMGEDGWTVVL